MSPEDAMTGHPPREANLSLINVLKHEASDWTHVYQRMGARAYKFRPSPGWDDEAVANLYASFLSSLCGTDYTLHGWLDAAEERGTSGWPRP